MPVLFLLVVKQAWLWWTKRGQSTATKYLCSILLAIIHITCPCLSMKWTLLSLIFWNQADAVIHIYNPIPVKQEDLESKVSQGYIAKPCLTESEIEQMLPRSYPLLLSSLHLPKITIFSYYSFVYFWNFYKRNHTIGIIEPAFYVQSYLCKCCTVCCV